MQRVRISVFPDIKCIEHGTLGMLPCAWPGCPNGVKGDEFEEEPLFPKAETKRWSRREWKSPFGGTYFSWQSSSLGSYFGARATIWNEARRLGLTRDRHPETIYHYTSLEGFMAIVSSRSVWMTDFAYLNDRQEVRYGLDLLHETARGMLDEKSNEEARSLLSNWMEKLRSFNNRVCITSFSGADDSLSQWRAYGPVAIGFPVRPLSLHVTEGRLHPVEYKPEVQYKLAKVFLHHMVSAFLADLTDREPDSAFDIYRNSDDLLELAVALKNPAFQSEQEYRLVYIDNPELLNRFGVAVPPRLFRAARGRIIPYVPSTDVLPSDNHHPLEISEVVLGPESDFLLEQGVQEFLNEEGLSAVTVRRSLVPFRQ